MVGIKLLGSSVVWINETLASDISAKAHALLVYLAMTRVPQHRSHVASLLWTNKPAPQALTNLRGILHELKTLAEAHKISLVEADRKTLQLSSTTDVIVDTHTFETLVRDLTSKTKLEQAVSQYDGEFMQNFNVIGADDFENWVTTTRARLHDKYITALENLANLHDVSNEQDQAINFLQKLVHTEPFREDIHLQLMKLFVNAGQRANALLQYDTCKNILARELNTEPSPELQSYYQELVGKQTRSYSETALQLQPNESSTNESSASSIHHHKFIVGPPITQPEHFFGRDYYLRRIFGWWQQPPFGHVAIIGHRRSGKTSLLQHLKPISGYCPVTRNAKQKTHWLEEAEHYRWMFIDFQDPRMRRLSSLLSYLLIHFDITPPNNCTLELFMDLATEKQWTIPTIILMDELEAGLAADELDQSFWWAMRALTQITDGMIGIAVASHEQPMKIADSLDKSSPFFNIFTTLELGPFTETEAQEFIDSIDQRYSTEECDWILQQSGCWPCLLQLLCQEKYLAVQNDIGVENWRNNALHQLQRYRYLLQ